MRTDARFKWFLNLARVAHIKRFRETKRDDETKQIHRLYKSIFIFISYNRFFLYIISRQIFPKSISIVKNVEEVNILLWIIDEIFNGYSHIWLIFN